MDHLAFGPRAGIPENVRAKWGARLIWPNDLVPNRQDLVAEDDDAKRALIAWLDGEPRGHGAIAKLREALREPYSLGLSPMSDTPVTLYEDAEGTIIGNPQMSGGYVYVGAWLKAPAEVCAGTADHDGQTINDCDECNPEVTA